MTLKMAQKHLLPQADSKVAGGSKILASLRFFGLYLLALLLFPVCAQSQLSSNGKYVNQFGAIMEINGTRLLYTGRWSEQEVVRKAFTFTPAPDGKFPMGRLNCSVKANSINCLRADDNLLLTYVSLEGVKNRTSGESTQQPTKANSLGNGRYINQFGGIWDIEGAVIYFTGEWAEARVVRKPFALVVGTEGKFSWGQQICSIKTDFISCLRARDNRVFNFKLESAPKTSPEIYAKEANTQPQQQATIQPQISAQPQIAVQPQQAPLGSVSQVPAARIPQGRKVALLIGNSAYQKVGALQNPKNDVQLLAATLKSASFQSVVVKMDLTQQQTLQALRDFAAVADGADWAVLYYSGHGIEFGGANYLVPVDANLKTDRDVDLEAVDVGKVISAIEGAKRLRLVILDACRDNPFASQMKRTVASRSVGRGLARIEPEAGTLIAYAAKHGETALDGDGANSPYAQALAKRIQQTPALEVRRLFDVVRDDVMDATGQKQQPFSYGSVSGSMDFYFAQK